MSSRYLWPLGLLFACSAGGDDAGEVRAFEEPSPVKYETLPEDPVELNVPADAVSAGALDLEVGQGEARYLRFEKTAGKHYIIGLHGLTADLDLYGHFAPGIRRDNHHRSSLAYGTEDEQIEFLAKESGRYYLMVYGFEAGAGRIELFVSEPTDEVGWPVEWGMDSASNADVVGGGLNWLERYNYGVGCGLTFHPGLDLNFGSGEADFGLPVSAVAQGRVVASARDNTSSWGNAVMIEHTLSTGVHFWSQYGHLDQRHVAVGDEVVRGAEIGTIGRGNGLSPHLHFEIRTADFGVFRFPCSQGQHSVEANYTDPGEFVRTH